jgi:hypothetical protein
MFATPVRSACSTEKESHILPIFTVTWRHKFRIVEPEETVVARVLLDKHVFEARDVHAII